ncbi:glycerophosphodiester phosphodiesterase [Nitrincola sp. A-D6]|uniref:glycerophosphodiester phosphodiesterase n=1 Tax=Nitrincola sp. A-D6 TaxID=1545442 RepID=UPI001185EC27|nr:glycerophosphodiester phosphodiesterase [Nitrincola sp. A-D6]
MANVSSYLNSLANHLWALAPGSRTVPDTQVKLIAHRGVHGSGIKENTLEAFDLGLQQGIWGIEMDIQLTRDAEPVIHHDPGCGRLFNRPDLVIADTTFSTLRQAIPDIPHLDEVVTRYGGQLHLMLEIKNSWRDRAELPARITEALRPLTAVDDYHLLSLVPDYLEGFLQIPPAAYVDVAEMNTREIIKQNLALGHGAVAGSFALLTTANLRQLQQAGKQVGTGMVEKRAIVNREVYRGVDWIFTDQILSLLTHTDKHN